MRSSGRQASAGPREPAPLWLLIPLFALLSMPAGKAAAATFDCARAQLRVDYVICGSADAMEANRALSSTWIELSARVPSDQKAAVVQQQRDWIAAYAARCGIPGRGRLTAMPGGAEACVIREILSRTDELRALFSAPGSPAQPVPTSIAQVDDRSTAAAFLEGLYRPYLTGQVTAPYSHKVEDYFAPGLATAYRKDVADSAKGDEPPAVDGDPLLDSQAAQVRKLKVGATLTGPARAKGTATYKDANSANPGQDHVVTLDLVQTDQGWRIDDIHYGATGQTLSRLLAGQDAPPTPHAVASDCTFKPSLTVDTQSAMPVDAWLPIRWSRCQASGRLETPTFLMISLPDEVRLRGVGFFALRPGARAPFDLDVDTDRLRVFIPLHQPLLPTSGLVEVSPLTAADLSIHAVVFRHEASQNVVLLRSPALTKHVEPNAPKIGISKDVPSESPQQVRQSDDGRWTLRIYPRFYEVSHRRTGDMVLRRAGVNPVFSPTQRFLVAEKPPMTEVDVFDLEARRLVRENLRNHLVWLHRDSIVLENWGRYCSVIAISTMVDLAPKERDPTTGPGSGACNAWTDSQADLNIDGGYLANSTASMPVDTSGGLDVISLTRVPFDDRIKGTQSLQTAAFVRENLDAAYAGPPRVWRLGDRARFVSGKFGSSDSELPFLVTTSQPVPADQGEPANLTGSPSTTPVVAGQPEAKDDIGALERALEKLADKPLGPVMQAVPAMEANEYYQDVLGQKPGFYAHGPGPARTVRIVAKSGGCDDGDYSSPVYARMDEVAFEMPNLGTLPIQLAYWPQTARDVAVLSFVLAGTDASSVDTRILRRQANGAWLSDCRHASTAADDDTDLSFTSAGALPPRPYLFPNGDIALVYIGYNRLEIIPAEPAAPVCQLNGLRQAEAVQSLLRIASDRIAVWNRTGDLDIFRCPNGPRILSGSWRAKNLIILSRTDW